MATAAFSFGTLKDLVWPVRSLFDAHVHATTTTSTFFVAHHRDPFLRFATSRGIQALEVRWILPIGNSGSLTENADAHALHFFDNVRLVVRFVRAFRNCSPTARNLLRPAFSITFAKLYLVVTHGHGVIAQRIHRQHHGIGRSVIATVVKVFEWVPWIVSPESAAAGRIVLRLLINVALGDAHVIVPAV